MFVQQKMTKFIVFVISIPHILLYGTGRNAVTGKQVRKYESSLHLYFQCLTGEGCPLTV